MRSRGFTLLEVLVALGVLGVVLALSMPAVSARLERGSFEGAAERLAGAVRTGAVESRASGRGVEVRARTTGAGALVIEWAYAGHGPSEPASGLEDDSDPGGVLAPVPGERVWTVLTELARGFELAESDPGQMLEGAVEGSFPGAPLEELALGEATERVRTLAVFLPSSEAVVSSPVWLVPGPVDALDPPARWAAISVNPWTARVAVEFRTPDWSAGDEGAFDDAAMFSEGAFDDLAPPDGEAP